MLCLSCRHFKKNKCNYKYNFSVKVVLDKVYAQGRADVINECISRIDKLTTYYAGDKEGNAITPKVVIKEDVINVLEQLKEEK